MKKALIFWMITFFVIPTINAQVKKIMITKIPVAEDAFVQGGQTADEMMGITEVKKLRIGNSRGDTKYSRITYLKFDLPKKKIKNISAISLNIPIKVFIRKEDTEKKFELDVYIVKNSRWKENKITWNNKPEVDINIANVSIEQSLDKQSLWQIIELDISEINKLINQKKRKITLALTNMRSNKTSAICSSRETAGSASYLSIESTESM
ncbi:DUF7594 domain-containing protein [Aquimarina algiphila]|uniref:CBM96 family carbohydrate-binding protein n=1 Tax=Aquimarina algiphila TaxID=2047982 RepID=UPI0024908B79|nr:DNRLRE domain-containing protein [Aquimarina algiphila]